MSDFLNDVMAFPYLTVKNRVGNHVMCYMESKGKEMHFLATDKDDWYGILMVQHQGKLTRDQGSRVEQLLRALPPRPLPMVFSFEYHELMHDVRAVVRWPLHAEYFGHEDVEQAIHLLFEQWTTVEPFIRRVCDGEDLEAVIATAKEQCASIYPTSEVLLTNLQSQARSIDDDCELDESGTLHFDFSHVPQRYRCELRQIATSLYFRASCELEITPEQLQDAQRIAALTKRRVELSRLASLLAEHQLQVTVSFPLMRALPFMNPAELAAEIEKAIGYVDAVLLTFKCAIRENNERCDSMLVALATVPAHLLRSRWDSRSPTLHAEVD